MLASPSLSAPRSIGKSIPESVGDSITGLPSLPPAITLDPADLADHPLLGHIPVWPKDSEEFKSLRESIRADGQLYEILIDRHRRVIDGRNRRNALAALGRPVLCRPVADDQVGTIVFRTLMQRRHLGKGARAFLAVPLVEPIIEAARARNLACLRRGETPGVGSSDSGAPTIEQIALDVGVSRDTFFTAKKLHEILARAEEDVRADVTSRVLSGELELGYAVTVLANHRDKADRATRLGKRAKHDTLFDRCLPKLDLHWRKASDEQKEAIREKLRSRLAAWPLDLIEEVDRAARAARKRAQETI